MARSESGQHWWSRPLREGQTIALGRQRPDADWAVPWDPYISRIHALLHWKNGRLWVRRHPQARNPIFVAGQEADEFTVGPREPFVIGTTLFEVHETAEDTIAVNATPDVAELVVEASDRGGGQIHGDPRLQVLFELPEILERLSAADDPVRLFLEVLLRGMPHASWAALVRFKGDETSAPVEVVTWFDREARAAVPRVSRRLVSAALHRRRRGIAHVWAEGDIRTEPEFTAPARLDWAICVPVEGAPSADLGFYVAGTLRRLGFSPENARKRLEDDVRFVDLVGRIYGALRRLHDLQARQSVLAQFFPRPILGLLLSHRDLEKLLRPREVTVTVLFCDLRGSSHYAEEWPGDPVGLWHRISDALSVMSSSISDLGGILGDLQGDSAMGFWGWPVADEGRGEKAIRAAVAIYRKFEGVASDSRHPLAGFRCGVGIASGNAVAGRLGTPEQFKVTVYGPVTNVAARLQALTKTLGASILVDEATAQVAYDAVAAGGWAVLRRVGPVRLAGMKRATTVYEVLPVAPSKPNVEPADVQSFEAAMRLIEAGEWSEAARRLESRSDDPVARSLSQMLKRFGYAPPAGWDGVIEHEWLTGAPA